MVLILALLTAIACKKDEINDDTPPDNTYIPKGYMQMKVGSYWIYQHFKINPNGSDSAYSTTDSVFISGTKTINNNTYYKFEIEGWTNSVMYYRDSLGNKVDTNGRIYMSEVSFNDTILTHTNSMGGNPIFHLARIMYDSDSTIDVPAGVFNNCIVAKSYVKLYIPTSGSNPYADYDYYAKNIGLVQSSYRWSSSGQMWERRLLRYYIPQ